MCGLNSLIGDVVMKAKINKTPKKICNFNELKNYLKGPCEAGNEILDAFECLTDAAIIFCPTVLGPQFLPLLGVLDVKDRLFNMSRKVLDFMTDRIKPDCKTKMEQLKYAYALISVTSYYEELSNVFPKEIAKVLKRELSTLAGKVGTNSEIADTPQSSVRITDFYADHITTYTEVKENIYSRYKKASAHLVSLLNDVSNTCKEEEKTELEKVKQKLAKLPEKAIKTYDAQYWELANEFSDFALFAQLEILKGIDSSNVQNKKSIEKLRLTADRIDIGFKEFKESVNSIITDFKMHEDQDIVDELKIVYEASIKKPIIEHKEIESQDEKRNIEFPKIVDAFIPQCYKCLLYNDESIKLEDEKVWDSTAPQHDIEPFIMRYLSSPDSIENPLIILGQPGSGKSLLTKVLSAQLMSESYIAIRIPLREVNADSRIDSLVAKQIAYDANRNLPFGYGAFASHFVERPLIIILDGYDELLQAKGQVFSNYLENVQAFQQSQKELNRPVRIIITSRINLIDKAIIPLNSTILRLMDFNLKQQEKWIAIWNKTNEKYFASKGISPFELPAVKGKNSSILDLAKQPLLLLMLALYDSDSNELVRNESINRTELYDKLIRRFIRRERCRYVKNFTGKSPEEQEEIIDEEMMRLGIVAIGMYNRHDFVISSKQLESDLNIYKAHRNDNDIDSSALKDSDSLLGGFFFIHQSKAKEGDKQICAYEFLHTTFGEFLAADFILRNTTKKVISVYLNNKFNRYNSENLSLPNGFDSEWFYCLMFVPLYSRPVVVEMMREHIDRFLFHSNNNYTNDSNNNIIDKEQYIHVLHLIIKEQIKMVLTTRSIPAVMCGDKLFDNDMSLLGHITTYSLNLIILAGAISHTGFEFDEEAYIQATNSSRETHPWNELVSLWKTWFSEEELIELSNILKAKRLDDSKILVQCKEKFEASKLKQPIDITLCVSYSLCDSFLAGLSGIHTNNFNDVTGVSDESALIEFQHLNYEIYYSYVIKLLSNKCNKINTISYITTHFEEICKINEIIESNILNSAVIPNISSNTMVLLYDVLEQCLLKKIVYVSMREKLINYLFALSRKNDYLSHSVKELYYIYPLLFVHTTYSSRENHYVFTKKIYDDFYNVHDLSHKGIVYLNFDYLYEKDSLFSDMDRQFIVSLITSLNTSSPNVYERDFIRFFDVNTVNNLLLINPELLLRSLHTLLDYNGNDKRKIKTIVFNISKSLFENFNPSDLGALRLDTIYELISFAQLTKNQESYESLCSLVVTLFSDTSLSAISKYLFLNPKYTIDLIQVIPEDKVTSLHLIPLTFVRAPIFEKEVMRNINYKTLCEFLKVLRLCINIKGPQHEDYSMDISYIIRNIISFISEEVDLRDLTVYQIEEIRSCAELIYFKSMLIKIDELLKT